ncbi:MAG: GNAT family N-acetyltransferase [Bacteroidota bacterium]
MKYLLTGEESERLHFRKVEEPDFDWWMEFASNKEAVRYFDFTDELSPEQFCRVWFGKIFERYSQNTGGHNILVEKETGNPVGMCGLLIQEVDGIKELEIGYSIHPKHWGKGFATEAAQKCKEFAFKNNFAESLISIVHVDNIASAKVARRNGMYLKKKTVYKDIPVNIFRVLKDITLQAEDIPK